MRTEQESREATARLQALHRRPTRYELVAESPSGERTLLGYSVRRTRAVMLGLAQEHGKELVALMELGDDTGIQFERDPTPAAPVMMVANSWRIRYTGRTERCAIIEGELPHIAHRKETAA